MFRSLDDIEILDNTKILGEGAFSEVFRVRSKKDGKMYALKQVNLSDKSFEIVSTRRGEPKY